MSYTYEYFKASADYVRSVVPWTPEVAIVLGSYAASAALVAAATTLLTFTGVARSDAFTLSAALGFLVYLGLGLWAAAERRLVRLFVVLASLTAGGAAVAALIAGGAI